MRRMALGLMALAVCVMMVAPVAIAGTPGGGGGGKYSSIAPISGSSNGFSAGPTQGEWLSGSGWFRWFVAPTPSQNNKIGPGGPITVYQPVSVFGSSIYSNNHGEQFWIWDAVNKNYVSPSKLSQKTYYLPDPKLEVHFWIMIEGIANPAAGQPGQRDTIQLTISLDTSKLPSGQQVALSIGAKQVILSGTDVHFHYDDMHQIINWDNPLYGSASHSFVFTMDK